MKCECKKLKKIFGKNEIGIRYQETATVENVKQASTKCKKRPN